MLDLQGPHCGQHRHCTGKLADTVALTISMVTLNPARSLTCSKGFLHLKAGP